MKLFEWPNEIDPPVHFANHQWAVTSYGVECLTSHYPIEKVRLAEKWRGDSAISEWVMHLSEKEWCDIHCFAEALAYGLEFHRTKGRTLIDLARSLSRAVKRREESKKFDDFFEWITSKDRAKAELIGQLYTFSAAELKAAHDLYEEAVRSGEWRP